ncbi:MAG TPA: YceI family protein [Gemmatimonadaceae bacterium]|jgi:polyisoprenoid-binding protein YceI|nr:YceI family protein [Gemmatimonadaceae bacterium]
MNDETTTTWTIDPTHAEVAFAVRHLMLSTVRGRFGAVAGTIQLDERNPAKSTVDVTVDVSSIDTRQEMRDNHLRSPDFFDVANHPTLRFVSKHVEGDINGEFRVVGDLTIRGTSKEVKLEVSLQGRGRDPWGNERAGFEAKGKINRSEFGLTWNQALEAGGVAVGDEVKISIDVELVKQVAAETAAA